MGQEPLKPEATRSGVFSLGRIGGVEIPNRIVMPAMTTRLADAEGRVSVANSYSRGDRKFEKATAMLFPALSR